jgi:hypothetical protein
MPFDHPSSLLTPQDIPAAKDGRQGSVAERNERHRQTWPLVHHSAILSSFSINSALHHLGTWLVQLKTWYHTLLHPSWTTTRTCRQQAAGIESRLTEQHSLGFNRRLDSIYGMPDHNRSVTRCFPDASREHHLLISAISVPAVSRMRHTHSTDISRARESMSETTKTRERLSRRVFLW